MVQGQEPSDLGLGDEEEEVLDVLDLPQLYTKPTATVLLATLADLSTEPLSWDATPRSGTPKSVSGASTPRRRKRKVRSEGVPTYLTKIISSPLAWIKDDGQKEQIWEAASQRLSERSGRTAMGAISRTFSVPLSPIAAPPVNGMEDKDTEHAVETVGEDMLEISLHEPALTADNVGLKTWASSYLLAKRLVGLRSSLPPLADSDHVLELGAGTGLVGMAAAAILRTNVILTDLPDILPNLERNVQSNALSITSHGGGQVQTAVLDWSNPAAFSPPTTNLHSHDGDWPAHSFPLILAADCIYDVEQPRLLVQAIEQHLHRGTTARVVVEIPVREGFAAERHDFRDRMGGLGLAVLGEGEEVGFDDWGSGSGEEGLAEVKCWWSVWGWGSDPVLDRDALTSR